MIPDALLPELVEIVQDEYDNWEAEGGWGCCNRIACALANRLRLEGFDAQVFDWRTDPPHSSLWASDGRVTVGVDVPWQRYEEFRNRLWFKVPGVTFTTADLVVTRINTDDGRDFTLRAAQWLGVRGPFALHTSDEGPQSDVGDEELQELAQIDGNH